MPSKYSFRKFNRSQASLPIQSAQEPKTYPAPPVQTPVQTPLHSPAYAPPQPSPGAAYPQGEENNNYTRPLASDEARFHRQSVPARSQSQRSPPSSFSGPTIQLVGPSPRGIEPPSSDEDPQTHYKPTPPVAPQKDDQRTRKKSLFGFGSSSSTLESGKLPPSSQRGLDRSVSVRRKPPAPQISTNAESQQTQQRWPLGPNPSTYSPPIGDEEAPAGVKVEGASPEIASRVPAVPAKDPVRVPQHRYSLQQEQYHGQTPSQQRVNTDQSNRLPSDHQQGVRESSPRERGAASSYQLQQAPSQQQPHHQTFHPSPTSTTSPSSHPLPLRGAQDLLQQPNLEAQISRPPSRQSIEPVSKQPYDPPSPTLQPTPPTPPHAQGSMGPPPGQPPQNRRSMESSQPNTSAGLPREGSSYQSYGQGGQGQNHGSQLGANSQQGVNYRGPPQAPLIAPAIPGEQGRSTPPPSRSRDDLGGLDVAQLARYEELFEKYRKLKKYYFEKDTQVEQLQNILAHQRLSQSHTSLDDSEYNTRFTRLDGAINQLSFNIRKEWRSIPLWLSPHVNKDAASTGTKEMTAVGRACITRWLVDEILERYFHPALEPGLSSQLKIIEKNLRRFAPPTPSDEEKDALLFKIANWRLTTLEGLQEMLSSPQAGECRSALTSNLIEKLMACLEMYLKEPAPVGLEGGVSMIVELAVEIAANLPLESRDVFVEYVLPGRAINERYMKVDGALPPLTNPGEGPIMEVNDKASIGNVEETDGASGETDRESLKEREHGGGKKKATMFGGFMAKKNAPAEKEASRGSVSGQGQQGPAKEERVRFSSFMAVEVRGRSVLVKAPVYI